MKKNDIQFRVALFDSPVKPYTITADNTDQEQVIMQDPRYMRWLTGWMREGDEPVEPKPE